MKLKKGKKTKGRLKNGNGISKIQRIREMLAEKESWTLGDLVKRPGYDARNVRVAMFVLKSPKSTKNPLVTDYDRETKTYTLKGGDSNAQHL